MKNIVISICLLGASVGESAVAGEDVCAALDGAIIVNDDGQYLGKISNKFDSNSIFNKFGSYGSKFNTDSIWNKFGQNGSAFASSSWANKYSSSPPRIIKDRTVLGVLSANKTVAGALNPIVIGAVCYDYEPD